MQENLVRALRSRLPQIREQWETLLHVEPVQTPLAYPAALTHLLDWTLEEIFQALETLPPRRRVSRKATAPKERLVCPCGRNPLLSYFKAGEQAMRDALVVAQVALPSLDPIERDAALEELDLVVHQIARREIESFCGVCQFRESQSPMITGHSPDDSALAPALTTARLSFAQEPP